MTAGSVGAPLPAGVPADVACELIKGPGIVPASSRDEAVATRVSEMLSRIERGGIDAVRAYSRELDGCDRDDFEVTGAEVAAATDSLSAELREAIAFAQAQVRRFAEHQRSTLVDTELPTLDGVVLGQRQVPIARVGAYVPSGRVPMLASSFMTVLVAKTAGVKTVIACSPPRGGKGIHAPVLHSIATSGADRIYALGGVQALAAMAFGLLGDGDGDGGAGGRGPGPVDMIVGPGNAFVAEAKRQLFGRVGIDLLAGPSEITVLADESADPVLVAADLLGQAEHGPTSPAVLVTTSSELATATVAEIGRQLDRLAGLDGADEVPRRAWEDYGAAIVVGSREDAVRVVDGIAPEHLEVQTAEDRWYFEHLSNYGSVFLGERSTVAFSDKAIGTNHTLPTGQAARYTGGLSVAKFIKTLTFQRVDTDAGVRAIAPTVAEISRADLMPAHEATANLRLQRWGSA
jgi:sulfopropanediol 3-dehydrogenase